MRTNNGYEKIKGYGRYSRENAEYVQCGGGGTETEEFRPIWSPMEEFAGNVAELGVMMEKIRNALEIQATDLKGTTIEKKLARVRLVDVMLPVIYGVRVLGIFTNDKELEMSIWFNRWQLMHCGITFWRAGR